ncbi:MAG: pyruvate dehydrogenase (acetyl-transferring), homodimeric type [Deltaproteobacteria bacterium]|nr:pyruvate dehydrogenase (acetyl-transferring), homodimeric type [Deltaproteobacteria bacterium]
MFRDLSYRLPDPDPVQTSEWVDSVSAVAHHQGPSRVKYIVRRLIDHARVLGVDLPVQVQTPYINTIGPESEPPYPGDERLEKRIRRLIRWNAAVMVLRANKHYPGIGGHLSTYASAASLYEVGFNHFFRGRDFPGGGDQIFFQGHATPGIYARAFLEGRLTADQLERFRREVELGKGLSSYAHPRLMPRFWEFSTVSMGLGPITAIYQARFNRYLQARGLKSTDSSRVWAFLGDGECDEPEALGAISLASRERLDNLIFVINCNLQRLDGPVRGNGKIIQQLETMFRGAGWNVIKVIWGREWDELLARDSDLRLVERMNEVVDGEFQRYSVESGDYVRNKFFGADPELLKLVEHLSDEGIEKLRRGGHDMHKLFAGFKAATEHRGAPTVLLAHTVKGWALGKGVEAKNITHQAKKLDEEELRTFRNRLQLDIPDRDLKDPPFFHPGMESEEVQYMLERRRALGGPVPTRAVHSRPLAVPHDDLFAEFLAGSKTEVSTTMAFARLLSKLLRDDAIGRRIVPIIPDEARSFGLDPLFRQVGIYSAVGQLYEPVDHALILNYHESKDGQLLEEGITEAGSMASLTAAGTAHATHGEPMIPFYMFYSMFGFQRTADQIWAMGDMKGRGFLIGGTAGRTTLAGEGLQHDDGHSHILASTVPSIVAYDPAFAYELAVIIRDGLQRMFGNQEDLVYYVTIQNETYSMPAMPDGARDGILRGLYRLRGATGAGRCKATLFGSGSILREVLRAQQLLEGFDVSADVWSAPSYLQLRREALAAERWSMLHPEAPARESYLGTVLRDIQGPIIAASDWMKAVPDQIARWVRVPFAVLGTDGYGLSDDRAALRRHFEVDAESIVVATLHELAKAGQVERGVVTRALQEFGIDPEKIDPSTV